MEEDEKYYDEDDQKAKEAHDHVMTIIGRILVSLLLFGVFTLVIYKDSRKKEDTIALLKAMGYTNVNAKVFDLG